MSTAADISLDVMLEGEEYFNAEELDEKAILGEEEDDRPKSATAEIKTETEVPNDNGDNDDLYDAAIEPSGVIDVKRESAEIQSSLPTSNQLQQTATYQASSANTSGKRYCCYIGNMTWWTTDQDLQKAIETCGAFDLVDMKFYENRNNGQSKGFALGVFASELSVKKLMENLPKIKVHDQSLVVLPYTKQSLAKLEDATKRIDQARDKKMVDEKSGMPYVGSVRIGMNGSTPQVQVQMPQINLGQQLANNLQRAVASTPVVSSAPASLMSLNLAPPPPGTTQASQQQQQLQMRAPSAGVIQQQPQGMPQVLLQQRPQQINLSAPPPTGIITSVAMNRPPPGFHQVQQQFVGAPQMVNTSNPPPMTVNIGAGGGFNLAGGARQQPQFQFAGMNLTSVPPPIANVPPGSHINPQVYPSFAHQYGGGGIPENGNVISESDFEDIMNRNRTVSSSAITRAVSDAAAGDYASAIETLVTAISLIRQSRVANDDRCKVLIASLQDTLNGIEGKSYNSSHKRRTNRDRSRSPSDRGSSRKRHRRSRSRSRSSERYDYSSSRHALSRRY